MASDKIMPSAMHRLQVNHTKKLVSTACYLVNLFQLPEKFQESSFRLLYQFDVA